MIATAGLVTQLSDRYSFEKRRDLPLLEFAAFGLAGKLDSRNIFTSLATQMDDKTPLRGELLRLLHKQKQKRIKRVA